MLSRSLVTAFNNGGSLASASLRCPLALSCTDYVFSSQTPLEPTLNSCSSCPPYNISARTTYQTPFIVVLQSFSWEHVRLQRRYSLTAAYTWCLLRICCLANGCLLLSPSNGFKSYMINLYYQNVKQITQYLHK
jgi:hypothetical protein